MPTIAAIGSAASAALYSTLASAAISAVGAGVNAYAGQQQAKSQSAIADYNYKVEQQNADIAARSAQLQAGWRAQQAAAEQQNRLNNAAALEAQARATEAQGRESARRMRDENDQRLAMMRSRYAASGVTTEGSPLATMAKSAGMLELAVQDEAYKTEMEARAYDRKAAGERYQSGYSLFDKQVAEYEQAAASVGRSLDLQQARMNLASAKSIANSASISSYGSLLSNVSSAIGSFAKVSKASKAAAAAPSTAAS